MAVARRLAPLVVALVVAACAAGPDPGGPPGSSVEVLAVWQDTEAERFGDVLARFEEREGFPVRYVSTDGEDIGEVLDARISDGDPPDLAILPLPGLLQRYAGAGVIQPLDDLVGVEVADRYGAEWQDLATVDGSLYGVWFKAAHKSLIWYDVRTFEDLGVVPPSDLGGLSQVADDLAAAGIAPFAVAARDEWTLTDLFENLYLRVAGPARYDELAERRLPWTDPTVHETLRLMGRLLHLRLLDGAETLTTTFPESVRQVFGRRVGPAMLPGADFVAGFVASDTDAELGVDADVFLFPEAEGGAPLVVAGGDVVVVLRRSPAADALLRYLASPEAGEEWAARGGFVSPNEDVSLESYRDDRTRTIARSLLEAGDGFRFDLSDLQPVEFGGTRGRGMLEILRDFVRQPGDVAGTAQRLEDAATRSTGVSAG